MSDKRTPKTPGEHTIEQVEAMRPLIKFLGLFSKSIREGFREVERQLDEVQRMKADQELFANVYSPLGWVLYDRISTAIVTNVVGLSVEEGEAALTSYHLDPSTLRSLGYRFATSHYEPWSHLFERAVERAAGGDHLSAIPLVLSIIDGICTTLAGKHPFSGGADAPVFDSMASGPGGLPEGLALLGSTRRKLDGAPLSIPFRHGIVHGLNPNYGYPIVAAKAFNLLQAIVDYFDRRRDEAERIAKAEDEQAPADLRVLAQSLRRNAGDRRALDEWRARPAVVGAVLASSQAPVDLPTGSPEAFAAEYLALLVNRNYGGLAAATIDYPKRPIGFRAGRLRNELTGVVITGWRITGVEDKAAAMSRVSTWLTGSLDQRLWEGEQAMRLMFADEDYDAVVRGQAGGRWCVMPDYLTNLWVLAMRQKGSGSRSS